MPDMAYSRAYETYSVTAEQKAALEKQGIHFSNMPVPGTIKRGELFPFLISLFVSEPAGRPALSDGPRDVSSGVQFLFVP